MSGHGHPVGTVTHVVFNITAAEMAFGTDVVKLAKDIWRVFCPSYWPGRSSVRDAHAQNDLFDSVIRCFLDHQIKRGNKAFGAFQRKALGADVFCFCTKSSKMTASVSRERIRNCSSRQRLYRFSWASIRFCNQLRTTRLSMCMNDMPMLRQYVLRSHVTISQRVRTSGPPIQLVENVRSQSSSVNLKNAGSNSGGSLCAAPSGSTRAIT